MPTLYLNGFETEAHVCRRGVRIDKLNHETESIDSIRVPLFDIDRVVLIGKASVTTPLLQRFIRYNIPVTFLSGHGRWEGTLTPTGNGHALRRLRQYELAKNRDFRLDVARDLIIAKISNSRRVLQRMAANRDEARIPEQQKACSELQSLCTRAAAAESVETLRGLEGYAGAVYFERLAAFFPDEIPFNGRNRRPPRDAANALMSWTYTIVLSEIDGAVQAAGLDPCFGFLHEISYGRPSLALDILEPLRAPLCDMLVLRLLNHRILKTENFEFNSDDGGTYMTQDARKPYFVEYERTMARRFSRAKNQPHTDFRNVIRDQVHEVLRAQEGHEDPLFFRMP